MKFKIQNQEFKIPFAFFGAVILFFCFSFAKIQQQILKYKTLNDSVFQVGDLIPLNVFYQLGKCPIRDDSVFHSMDTLKNVAKLLGKNSSLVIQIENHTDQDYSMMDTKISYGRAKACCDSLLKMGIDKNRIIAEGFGTSQPFILYKDIFVPSGKIIKKGTILTDKFLASVKSNEKDYQFLLAFNRRTEIRILRTDFGK